MRDASHFVSERDGSYYNRSWRGYFEVLDGPDWMRYNIILTSVEQGLALVKSNPIPGLKWRIVDQGLNIYESGQFEYDAIITDRRGNTLYVDFKSERDRIPPDVAARQERFYSDAYAGAVRKQADETRALVDPVLGGGDESVHIRASERRRLLEEALKGDDDGIA